jgi:hypothetical protein
MQIMWIKNESRKKRGMKRASLKEKINQEEAGVSSSSNSFWNSGLSCKDLKTGSF